MPRSLGECAQLLVQAALVAGGGILVDQPLADQAVDGGSCFAERQLRRGLVLGGDGAADFLYAAAQFRALTGVAGAVNFRLARAFLCLCCIGQNRSPENALKSGQLC